MAPSEARVYGPRGQLDDDLEVLAPEPQVGGTDDAGGFGSESGVRQHRPALFLDPPVRRFEPVPVEPGKRFGHRRHPVRPGRRQQEPEGGGDAGGRRADDPLDTEPRGEVPGMDRARPTRREQHVATGVASTLGDVDPRGARHGLGDHLEDSPGKLDSGESAPRLERSERGSGRIGTKAHVSPGEERRIEGSPARGRRR